MDFRSKIMWPCSSVKLLFETQLSTQTFGSWESKFGVRRLHQIRGVTLDPWAVPGVNSHSKDYLGMFRKSHRFESVGGKVLISPFLYIPLSIAIAPWTATSFPHVSPSFFRIGSFFGINQTINEWYSLNYFNLQLFSNSKCDASFWKK